MTQQYINEDCWYKDVCAVDCSNTCVRYLEMKYLMQSSGIPESRQKPVALTPQRIDSDAFKHLADIRLNIKDFVISGSNLYITSNSTGNGKTSWAIKLMLRYFDEIWAGNGFNVRGLFIHVPTFLLKCKNFDSKDAEFEYLKRLLPKVDLVIWDDIASTDISSYDYSQLLMYLDARSLNQKANIFTGNITTRDRLLTKLGAKLTSRVWSSTTDIVEFKGCDRR